MSSFLSRLCCQNEGSLLSYLVVESESYPHLTWLQLILTDRTSVLVNNKSFAFMISFSLIGSMLQTESLKAMKLGEW
jgi:hypothetical protein